MLDLLSHGRLISGFPVGTSMDTAYAYSVNPGVPAPEVPRGRRPGAQGVDRHRALRLQRALHADALRERAPPAAAAAPPAHLDPRRRLGRDVGLLLHPRLRLRRAVVLRAPDGQGDRGRLLADRRGERQGRQPVPAGVPPVHRRGGHRPGGVPAVQGAGRVLLQPLAPRVPGLCRPPGLSHRGIRPGALRITGPGHGAGQAGPARPDLGRDGGEGLRRHRQPRHRAGDPGGRGQDLQLRAPAHHAAVRQHERRAHPPQLEAVRREGRARACAACSATDDRGPCWWPVDGGGARRIEACDERALVYLPGIAGHPAGSPALDALGDAGWDVVVPEIPGLDGRSGFWAPDDYLGWLAVVWDALDATGALPCPVVGASLGGMLAADLAVFRPEAVHRCRCCSRRSASSTSRTPASTSTPCRRRSGWAISSPRACPNRSSSASPSSGPEDGPVARYLCDVAAASLLWPLGDRGPRRAPPPPQLPGAGALGRAGRAAARRHVARRGPTAACRWRSSPAPAICSSGTSPTASPAAWSSSWQASSLRGSDGSGRPSRVPLLPLLPLHRPAGRPPGARVALGRLPQHQLRPDGRATTCTTATCRRWCSPTSSATTGWSSTSTTTPSTR